MAIFNLLLENGDALLLEDGGLLLTEDSGAAEAVGNTDILLDPIVCMSAGALHITGAVSATLGNVLVNAAGSHGAVNTGGLNVTLAPITCVATGTSGGAGPVAGLVTLDEAKLYCRIDEDHEDATLAILIGSASDTVRDYANGWDGIGTVPPRLKLATLALVAAHFGVREEVSDVHLERILSPHRVLDV